MTFITSFVTYLVKAIFFIAVAAAGFLAGKKAKASKQAKKQLTEE